MGSVGRVPILIVDDDEAVRDLLELMIRLDDRFELAGSAGNGLEAVEMTDRLRPSVVVLDLQMADMDGAAALVEIRQRHPGVRVVVLSAFPDPYTLLEVTSLGADAYLDKAHAFAELVPTLCAMCELEEAA